jgi:hypothetical protein
MSAGVEMGRGSDSGLIRSRRYDRMRRFSGEHDPCARFGVRQWCVVFQGDPESRTHVGQRGRMNRPTFARQLDGAKPAESWDPEPAGGAACIEYRTVEARVVSSHDSGTSAVSEARCQLLVQLEERFRSGQFGAAQAMNTLIGHLRTRWANEPLPALHDDAFVDANQRYGASAVVAVVGRFEVNRNERAWDGRTKRGGAELAHIRQESP